jgi:hypothetical protein
MSVNRIAGLLGAGALALSGAALAQTNAGSATGGSGGSAAAGTTSASTVGIGGTSTGPTGSASALGMGASAAAADGSAQSRAAVHGNRNLNGQAMAQAHDGGTFSKSHTHCKDRMGQDIDCRTKSMAHVPGQKPVMSTQTTSSSVPQR